MEKQCKTEPFKILMQTSKNIQDQIKVEINKSDLNITEFSVLETLYHKGQQTIHQIGNSILISSGSMTYVIDKLEKKDLLKRTDCPNDRRAIFIILTPKGEDLMDKIMPEYQEFINHMFDSLNTEEAGMLIKLLQKIKTTD
jgi:MarR family transcriptional regulator, 2-MHQ and catechol-resistance regulon repressor